jgi:hypothetical protein
MWAFYLAYREKVQTLSAQSPEPADAGQMHLYLNYAREHWVVPGLAGRCRISLRVQARRGSSCGVPFWS